MRRYSQPARALITALLAMLLIPALAGAQGSPAASPQAPDQAIWERLEGVERAVVRTWGDLPEGTPPPGQIPALRFVTGLVTQFGSPENAAAGVEPIRDWMLASLQVNIVDVSVTTEDVAVEGLGDRATAVRATGTAGQQPLSIAVVVAQDGDRVVAVGGSVMDERDLLPLAETIAAMMVEREPGGEEQRDNVGRYTGGLWELFPPREDAVLDGMRGQGDVPIYEAPAG